MIATYGDQMGHPNAWTAGTDFTYQTSRFRGDKNLVVSAWGLLNDKHDLDGDKSAYGAGFDYPNDRWSFNLTSARIGETSWPIELTLADRDVMGFRMLLGRAALRNRFLVDPTGSFRQPPFDQRSVPT